jgi:pimeloyl-ACP methyl ester carboxylesterase
MVNRNFSLPDITINFAEGGNPNARPMLMLHGIASWWQTFESLIPVLENDWHIYATDLRGCGKSGRAARSYLLTQYIDDNLRLLQRIASSPALLVGHSFGGLVAMGIAAREPQSVRGLVIIDAPFFFREGKLSETSWTRFFGRVIQLITETSSVEALADKLAERMPNASRDFLLERAAHLKRLDPEPIRMHMRDENMIGFDLNEVIRRVKCPTLVLHADPKLGGASRDVDIDWVEGQLSQATIVRIKDAGHMLHETHVPFVAEQMSDFFKKSDI